MRDSRESSVRALLERVIDEIGVVVTHKGWCVCEREGWKEKREKREEKRERVEGERVERERERREGKRRGREGCREKGEDGRINV